MKRVVNFLRKLFYSLGICFPAVLFLALGILLFPYVPQARDVIVYSAEHSYGMALFFTAIFFWAFVSWYSTRLVIYHEEYDEDENKPLTPYLKWTPRLLGALSFAPPAIAIFNLSYLKISATAQFFILLIYLLGISILPAVFSRYQKQKKLSSGFWLLLASLTFGTPWLIGFISGLETRLLFTGIYLLLSSYIFLWFTVYRRKATGNKKYKWLKEKASPLKVIPDYDMPWFIGFNLIAFFIFTTFIVATASLDIARFLLPASTPVIAFVIFLGIGNGLSFLGAHYRWNFHLTSWLIIFLVSLGVEPHLVSQTPNSGKLSDNRIALNDYFQQRYPLNVGSKDTIKDTLIFVLADGGASRSGYWTAAALGRLTDHPQWGSNFKHKLFALSGASGGATGIASYYGLRCDTQSTCGYEQRAKDFYANDFLSYPLIHMVGVDMFRYFMPKSILPNRAVALERSFEENRSPLAQAYKMPISHYIKHFGQHGAKKKLPLLMLNTTDLNAGWPGVISMVKLNKAVTGRKDVLKDTNKPAGLYDMNLSTAAILCSRFPYISPAGQLGQSYYIDGGYFDNFGAGIMHEMMIYLDSVAAAENRHLEYVVIHLKNSELKTEEEDRMNPLKNDLLTPPLAALRIIFKQTDMNDLRLRNYLRHRKGSDSNWITLNVLNKKPIKKQKTWWMKNTPAKWFLNSGEESIAMSWVISEKQRQDFNTKIDTQFNANQASLNYWLNK